ncbi:MAG: ABC transporter permease [Halanaerobiaceae bacterium]|nr:ABC transporter permease [Halanaerobiaceae bacterium]
MKGFNSLFIANIKDYLRDFGLIFLSLIFPVVLVLILGIIFGVETGSNNGEISTFSFILPGVLALTLMQLGLFSALGFLEAREKKILRGLSVIPVSRMALMASDLLIILLIGIVETILILSIGHFVFGVTIIGSLFKLLITVLLGILTFTSIGYLLICLVNSIKAGNCLVQIAQLVMAFLSGIFFSIEKMPGYLIPLTRIIPLTYLGDALRQIVLGSAGEYSLSLNISILIFALVVSILITMKLWRWE